MPSPKVVLVTGCSDGGIGSSLCTAFALRGCTVYATARKLAAMSTLAESIQRLEMDVTAQASVEAAVRAVLAKEGRIDILVNNAGAAGVGALLDFDVSQAAATFDVNVMGVLRVTQAVVPAMARERRGLVINIGSIVGNVPTPWGGIYASSKAALHSLTEVLRMEVKGFGVDVMLVAPGAVTSNFGRKQDTSIVKPQGTLYEAVWKFIVARAQMGQDDPYTLPTLTFAKLVVGKALQSQPPAYFTAGGKSWTFWWLERLPRWIVWWLVSRKMGATRVVPPPRGAGAKLVK